MLTKTIPLSIFENIDNFPAVGTVLINCLISIPESPNSPPTRTESLTFVNRFSLVGGLLSCVRYSYVTRKEILDEGLTSTSNRLVMFVSSYLQSITPTANYIAGLAIRFYNIETERQFAFDYAGNIYTRMKNLPNGEWTNWERKTT